MDLMLKKVKLNKDHCWAQSFTGEARAKEGMNETQIQICSLVAYKTHSGGALNLLAHP